VVLLASLLPVHAAVPWIKGETDTAFTEAKLKNRPLIIYFYAPWCSWCLTFDDKVFSDDAVVAATDPFVPLRLNCDHGACASLWKKYNLSSLPTVLVLTPKGEVLGRLGMYRPVPEFIRFLRECLTPGDTMAAVDKKIEQGERTPELLLRSAEQHFEANDFDAAARRYEQAIAAVPKDQTGIVPDARIGLGRLKSTRGDEAGALEQYDSVLRSHPDSNRLAEAFVSALVILRDQDRGKEIDALFREFASRFPDDPAVLNDHARRILETGGDPAIALAKAARAASLSPDTADFPYTVARALMALKRPVDALESINKAIELRPSDKDLRLLRLDILETVMKVPAPQPAASSGASGGPTATPLSKP